MQMLFKKISKNVGVPQDIGEKSICVYSILLYARVPGAVCHPSEWFRYFARRQGEKSIFCLTSISG